MTRAEKLIETFLGCEGPYPYRDFVRLLEFLGYVNRGAGGGSGRKFVHAGTRHIIRFHEPHPGNEIKPYLVRQVREQLQERGLL